MISQWSTFSYFGLIFKLVQAALRQEWGGREPVRRVLPQPRYKMEAPSWLRQSQRQKMEFRDIQEGWWEAREQ